MNNIFRIFEPFLREQTNDIRKCLALFSGNESDSSRQVENKRSLRPEQAWVVAYLYLWALSEPVALDKLAVPRFLYY